MRVWGATAAEYRKVRLNVFDSTLDPAGYFEGVEDDTDSRVAELMKLSAYQEITRDEDGRCGAAMLAEQSVAVPFVSAVAGAKHNRWILRVVHQATGELTVMAA